jgi:2',3'-cyclic-nucleotide 2'-phosphodiesterase (5'-nucleotidase family)
MKKLFFLVFLFFSCENHEKIAIFYTSNMNGVLRDCGCSGENIGGMPRLKTALDSLRKIYPKNYLIDTGDHLTSYPYPQKNKYVLKRMEKLHFDFALKADQEIKEKIDPSFYKFYKNHKKFDYFLPKEILESKKSIQKLESLNFLIFHGDSSLYENYKNKFLHKFVFLSHSEEKKFYKKEKSYFFQAGADTEYLGIAVFDENFQFIENKFLRLDFRIPENKKMKKIVDLFFEKHESAKNIK